MTKWLTEEEQQVWRLWLEVCLRQTAAIDDDLQASADVTLADYEILVRLADAPDRGMRMSELADQVIISRSRLTYRVDRLAGKGFVCREHVGEDRRGVEARLTDEGYAHLVRAAPGHVSKVQSLLFEHLDADDLAAMRTVLQKLIGPARS